MTWTAGEDQGPGKYEFTVKTEDNGEPVMSDTETFEVTVAGSAPAISVHINSRGQIGLASDGQINKTYEFLMSTDLKNWISLCRVRLATPPLTYTDEEAHGETVRFYLLRLVQE